MNSIRSKPLKVMVVGGSGYIGTYLSKALIDSGHHVTVFDRQIFNEAPHFASSWIHKDIRDAEMHDFDGIDVVLDYSGLSNDPSGEINIELTRDVNVNGRAHLAKTAKAAGVTNYIFASSCSVYGKNHTGLPLSEAGDCSPLTTYAKAAYEMESILKDLSDDKFAVLIIRHGTVYGFSKKMRLDLVVNLMIKSIIERNSIFVLGGGHQMRPLVSLKTISQFVSHVISENYFLKSIKYFDIVNLSEVNVSIRDLAHIIFKKIDPIHSKNIRIEIAPDDADARDYSVSTERLRNIYGFKVEQLCGDTIVKLYDSLNNFDRDEIRTRTQDWYRVILENENNIKSVGLLKR